MSTTIFFLYKESVVYPFIYFETIGNFFILTVEDFLEIIVYVKHHGMISLWYSDALLYFLIYLGYFHEVIDD